MNRRIFLKLLGLSPIVPSVLMAKESVHESLMRQGFRPLTATEIKGHWDKLRLEAAQREIYPAMLIHPDGRIEPITNEQLYINPDALSDPTKNFCEDAGRELPPLMRKNLDETILSLL